MSSTFDPATFLDASLDAPLVRRPPLPEGDYYALVGECTTRSWVGQKDPTKSGIAADYDIEVDVPPAIKEKLGFNSPTLKLRHGIMLDLTPTGGIDQAPGANGGLRRLREALDMNKPGDTFNLRKATGRPILVKIKHREYPEGSGELFEEIVGVARPT